MNRTGKTPVCNHVSFQQNQAKINSRSGKSPKVFAVSGLVPSSKKPLSEPVLTQAALPYGINVDSLCCHMASIGHNELMRPNYALVTYGNIDLGQHELR